jgi:hypothetical protein
MFPKARLRSTLRSRSARGWPKPRWGLAHLYVSLERWGRRGRRSQPFFVGTSQRTLCPIISDVSGPGFSVLQKGWALNSQFGNWPRTPSAFLLLLLLQPR